MLRRQDVEKKSPSDWRRDEWHRIASIGARRRLALDFKFGLRLRLWITSKRLELWQTRTVVLPVDVAVEICRHEQRLAHVTVRKPQVATALSRRRAKIGMLIVPVVNECFGGDERILAVPSVLVVSRAE